MLIWIDTSVLEANLANDADSLLGLNGIFESVYRGENYALGDRSTLISLAKNPNFSKLTQRIVETIISNLSTIGGIKHEIVSRINVTYGKAVACKKIDASTWEVPLKELGLYSVKKIALITENLVDANAFEHAAKQYQASKRIPGQVALEKLGGGGSTTPQLLESLANNEHRWCLCITDSDRLYPDAPMDSTAQKCKAISEKESIIAKHIDIEFREIENIMPIVFLEEVIPSTHRNQWDWQINKLNGLRLDCHRFCDIKKGMTLKKINSYTNDSPIRLYWEKVAKDLDKAKALTVNCTDQDECKQNSEISCKCYVSYGFGDKLLEAIIQNLNQRTPQKSETMIRQDSNRTQWINIGRAVFEWCCAPHKTRL